MSHAKRVMYLTVGPPLQQLYGAELSLLQFLDRLDPARFTVCSTVVQEEGAVTQALRARHLPVGLAGIRPFDRTLPLSAIPFASSFRRLLSIARETKPDLLHVNHLILNQYGALLARSLGVPSICHLRGRPTRRAYWGQLASLSSVIIANSQFTADAWAGIRGARAKLRVIHNGIAVQDYARGPRTEHRDRIVLGVIGRIDPDKGLEVFLRALPHVVCATPQVLALIAGDAGPEQRGYQRELHRLVDALGLTGFVRFLGAVADPRAFYSQLDALVLPSRYEPFGRVLIEAMAAGLPVVATESGGPSEVVEEGRTGLLVPTEDPVALAEAMQQVVRDPELRCRFGRAGLARAESHFSLERHIAAVEEVYAELTTSQMQTATLRRQVKTRA